MEVKKAIPRSEQLQYQQQQLQHRHYPNQQYPNRLCKNTTNSDIDNRFRTKKIFVGGLSASLTEEEFKNYFERFGQIMDVVVMHDNITNRPRGFGFVTFDSEETVEDVMKNNFHELNGRLVEVKRAVPKEEISNTTCNYNPRVGAGEESPYLISPYGYGPGYASAPSYLPLRVYYGGGVSLPGAGFYGGAYPPMVALGRYGYGVPHFALRSPFYGPFMIPYGNALTVPAHVNGGFGGVNTVAGGYNGFVDARVNKIEETKLGAVVSTGLNGSDDGATCGGDKKGLDGKFKALTVGVSR